MTNTERPLDSAVAAADRTAGSAAIDLDNAWQYASDRPLDLDGPTDIPFEPFDDGAIEGSIVSRFQEIARRYPTRTAIDDGVTRLTYAEVWRIVCHLARQVESVAPAGRPVAVILPNAALFPVAALACLAVARPYVPIDLDYPAARNAEILREAGAAAAITQAGLPSAEELIPTSLPLIYANFGEALAAADEPPLESVEFEGPAVILFTSGSTGRPKGICNDQTLLQLRIARYTNACHLNAEDRLILLHSPSTIAGVSQTFAALLNGATLRIAELRRLGISGVQQVIRDERISVYYSVPAVLRSLLGGADAKAALASLRIVRLSGDTTFESDLTLFQAVLPPTCHILITFGSTEALAVFQWFARPGMGDGLRLPSGFPLPGFAFALVGPDGLPVLPGEVGELVVRGRHLALGLWQDGRLVPGPFESDRTDPKFRILRTGDLFCIRPDGMAEPHGRIDRQIKNSRAASGSWRGRSGFAPLRRRCQFCGNRSPPKRHGEHAGRVRGAAARGAPIGQHGSERGGVNLAAGGKMPGCHPRHRGDPATDELQTRPGRARRLGSGMAQQQRNGGARWNFAGSPDRCLARPGCGQARLDGCVRRPIPGTRSDLGGCGRGFVEGASNAAAN